MTDDWSFGTGMLECMYIVCMFCGTEGSLILVYCIFILK